MLTHSIPIDTLLLIVHKADPDEFEMNFMGYDTNESNTLHNQDAVATEIVSTKNTGSIVASVSTVVADKPLFSCPQNRRASTVKYSQQSQKSSLPLVAHFMGSVRDRAPLIWACQQGGRER